MDQFTLISGTLCGLLLMTHSGSSSMYCKDFRNRNVPDGVSFIPNGEDPCTECTCENGEAQACVASVCSIPHDCRDVRKIMSDECCKFVCFDAKWRSISNYNKYNFSEVRPGIPAVPYHGGGFGTDERDYAAARDAYATNYTLRLGFTTMTTIVILLCLMFSVHRLRKRRLRALQALAQNRSTMYDEPDHFEDGCHCQVTEYETHNTFTRTDPPPPPYKQSPSVIELPPPYHEVVIDVTSNTQPLTTESISRPVARIESPS